MGVLCYRRTVDLLRFKKFARCAQNFLTSEYWQQTDAKNFFFSGSKKKILHHSKLRRDSAARKTRWRVCEPHLTSHRSPAKYISMKSKLVKLKDNPYVGVASQKISFCKLIQLLPNSGLPPDYRHLQRLFRLSKGQFVGHTAQLN